MWKKSPGRAIATKFLADERGATAIEYAMIAGFVSVAIAGTALGVGAALNENYYEQILAALKG